MSIYKLGDVAAWRRAACVLCAVQSETVGQCVCCVQSETVGRRVCCVQCRVGL